MNVVWKATGIVSWIWLRTLLTSLLIMVVMGGLAWSLVFIIHVLYAYFTNDMMMFGGELTEQHWNYFHLFLVFWSVSIIIAFILHVKNKIKKLG